MQYYTHFWTSVRVMLFCDVTAIVPTWISRSPQFRDFNFFVDFLQIRTVEAEIGV